MNMILPKKKGYSGDYTIEREQIVVVGANGSGKTRFGARIEEMNPQRVHRISAQKSLSFPKEVGTTSMV